MVTVSERSLLASPFFTRSVTYMGDRINPRLKT